jgi:hypothetical protein
MLRHAFQFVKRVVFLIGPQNVRSQKAIEKLGAFVSAQDPTPPDEILTSTKSHPCPSEVLNNIMTFLKLPSRRECSAGLRETWLNTCDTDVSRRSKVVRAMHFSVLAVD